MRELERRDVTADMNRLGGWTEVQCHGCGQKISLRYNGGELDCAGCCGFTYELDAPRIELVVYKP